MYVYIYGKTLEGLYTVGHYEPSEWKDHPSRFVAESEHSSTQEAAARVHFLNGGSGEAPSISSTLMSASLRLLSEGGFVEDGKTYQALIHSGGGTSVEIDLERFIHADGSVLYKLA